jgi:HK97 family phage major capsid protein
MTLHEEFNSIKEQSVALINKAKAEGRGLTNEETESNKKRFARLDEIKSIVKAEAEAAAYTLEADKALEQFARQAHEPMAKVSTVKGTDSQEQYAKARQEVNAWIRGDRQEFTLISTSGSSALLPTFVGPPVSIRRLNNAIIAGVLASGYQPLYTSDTATYSIPVFNDVSNNAINPSESNTTEEDQDVTLTNITLGATLYDSEALWFSNTLLLAPGFDILSYSEPHLQKRVDHKMQAVWTAAALGTSSINNKTGSSASGVTFADIIGWFHATPPQYRNDLVFTASDSLVQAMRGIVDSYGRPIYVESMVADMPDKLFGRPLFVNDSLSAVGANNVSGLAFSGECAKLRICTNRRLVRYMNLPTHTDAFGLELYMNAGAGFVPQGTTTFTQGAS